MLIHGMTVGSAGELGAAIGVNDEGRDRSTLSERHTQGGDDKRSIKDSMHGPADDAAGEEIKDSNEI
jgi:hypothetical protein